MEISEFNQRVLEIFSEALELSGDERHKFLEAECGNQVDLMSEVQSLLSLDERAMANGFMHDSALNISAKQFVEDLEDKSRIGETVDHYRIEALIGEGGMGEVYLANDQEFERNVALKFIRAGLTTKEVLRRFQTESQILGRLNHPNIATLIDGGTSQDGTNYFVMEYVEGVSIDQYANTNHLTVDERLGLFRTVCSAIHFAHQNLVIHRDIKPSNILVTSDGVPKLLDFGIAKLFDLSEDSDRQAATESIFRVMTPEYASPEQISGENISTSSDVYSLGVLLYELLTGESPYRFRSRSPEDVANVIRKIEPERPSSKVAGIAHKDRQIGTSEKRQICSPRALRGDLDNIVLKALRKEPERRYASVVEFSDDIRRYATGLPVLARKDTFGYRTSKFIHRNKIPLLATGAVGIVLIAGAIITGWQGYVARRERARAESERLIAERRFDQVRDLVHSVLFDYHDAIATLPGSTRARQVLVTDSLKYLDALMQTAGSDRALQIELASAYVKIGDVLGRPYHSNLGKTDEALESYEKALSLLQSPGPNHSSDQTVNRSLATVHERIGNIQLRKGKRTEAQTENEKSLEIRKALFDSDSANVSTRRELADSYLYVGDAIQANCVDAECVQKALDLQNKALTMRERLSNENPEDVDLLRDVAQALSRVGFRLADLRISKHDSSYAKSSLEIEQRALVIRHKVAASDPSNALDRRNLADQYMLCADSYLRMDEVDNAIDGYRQALAMFKPLFASDAYNIEARRDLSFVNYKLAMAFVKARDPKSAILSYIESVGISKQLHEMDPSNMEDTQTLIAAYVGLSEIYADRNNLSESIFYYGKAVELNEVEDKSLQTTQAHVDLGASYMQLAALNSKLAEEQAPGSERKLNICREALKWSNKARDVHRRIVDSGASNFGWSGSPTREISRCEGIAGT